ncbi:CRISPR-associated endonuclease Cas1 [Stieleria marina]
MVNEFVYCPRLFYLMHVEGQFANSVDTVDGQFVHRRVDSGTGGLDAAATTLAPGGVLHDLMAETIPRDAQDRTDGETEQDHAPKTRRRSKHVQPESLFGDDHADSTDNDMASETDCEPADVEFAGVDSEALELLDRSNACEPSQPDLTEENARDASVAAAAAKIIHRRSVMLSSDTLGVIAKMDLIEASGDAATPVDYKRGRPRQNADGTAGAWLPERVQVALQALVLQDNGYRCDGGVLYFNETRQRVSIALTDELLTQTRHAVDAARALRRSGTIPPPLSDSPKCPRCSLVGICLPDETRRLGLPTGEASDSPASDTISVRPMLTARDERRPVYFNTQGMWIGKQSEVLQAKVEGKIVQQIRLQEINQVNLFGNVQLSTQAIQTMLNLDIPVVYFTQKGYFYGITHSLGVKNIQVRREQFRFADQPTSCLDLARQIVRGKIRNQRTLLMRNHREPSSVTLRELKRLSDHALDAASLASLLGVEGAAGRAYFQSFAGMLKVDCSLESSPGSALSKRRPAFNFLGRNRRPPRDPVNALLSLAYSLLTKDCVVAATAVGLDPYLGFYHQIKPGKPALALDLMEPFRPLIADSVVLTAINNRMVTPEHFLVAGESVVLSKTGRKHFLLAYEQRMDQLVTHPLFDYRVSYRRLLEIQTRLVARLLTGEIPTYPVFETR